MKKAANRALSTMCFMLVYCLVYSWILKMTVKCYFERSVHFELITRRYIAEDSS
jgi:hypothetical protein